MPDYIATYDLSETNPGPHSAFLANALRNNWFLWIRANNGEAYRLPNTTLIGTFSTYEVAAASLEKVRADTQSELGRPVTMPRWIVAEYTVAKFNSDDVRK